MVNSWQQANTMTIWRESSKHNKDDKILQYIKKKGVKAIILTPFFLYILLKFRMWFKYGLKAQKLLAQGIALGMYGRKPVAL